MCVKHCVKQIARLIEGMLGQSQNIGSIGLGLRVFVRAQKQLVKLGTGRPPIAYDALSLDIGITPSAQGVPGALEHATPVKPVSRCTLQHTLRLGQVTPCSDKACIYAV